MKKYYITMVVVSGNNNFNGAPAINNGTFSTSSQSDKSAEITLLKELLEEKDRALRDKERTIQILLGKIGRKDDEQRTED